MDYFTIKNWDKFQHYKDRLPPWIKLHRELLNNYEFTCLQDASKLHLMLIWLLASQTDNKLPADPEWLKNALHIDTVPDLKALFDAGFIEIDSALLAECNQVAIVETEAETYKQETDNKKPLSKNKFSDDDLKVANFMLAELRLNIPNLKEPNIESWANTVRLMFDIDKRPHKDICELIRWTTRDSFWSANVLSPAKLREKFDQLTAKMTKGDNHEENRNASTPKAKQYSDTLDEIARRDIKENGFASTLDN